ncbi:MAG: hypothetical protein KC636_38160, partial [Myxococcales bacterium]|nr:hypothetical protein [Myxococcales bacterium]
LARATRQIRDRLTRPDALRSPACAELRRTLEDYVHDLDARQPTLPPFSAYELGVDGERCLNLDPTTVALAHFLTIRADGLNELFIAAATTREAALQWLDSADFIEVEGHKLAVVAVPRAAPVTIRARAQNLVLPIHWHGIVTHDATVWDNPLELGCLSITARLDQDSVLLVDGSPLLAGPLTATRTISLPNGAHELVALECVGEGERRVCRNRYRETLTSRGSGGVCEELRLDLERADTVALLGVTATASCDDSSIWDGDVRAHATRYLKESEPRTHLAFKDLQAYASLTGALGQLKSQLNPDAGGAVGAQTGADSLDLLGTAAKEAWRQGIDTLVTFDVRCIPARGDRPESTALRARAVSVAEVFRRRQDDLEGLDLDRFIREEAVGFTGPAQVGSATERVLDRLFSIAYLRVVEPRTAWTYRERARLKVATYRPGHARKDDDTARDRPIVEMRRLGDERDEPAICKALERGTYRSGPSAAELREAFEAAPKRPTPHVKIESSDDPIDFEGNTDARVHLVELRAPRTGVYLARARWQEATGRPEVDAVCLTFRANATELWGDVTITGNVFHYPTISGGADVLLVRPRLGFTWYAPRAWTGFGVHGGYSYTYTALANGVPSWIDLNANQMGSADKVSWIRHGLFLGPHIEFRSRRTWVPVDLRARLSPDLGVSIINVADVPVEFTSLRGGASALDKDTNVRVNVDLTLDLLLSYAIGRVTMMHGVQLGLTGLQDLITDATRVSAINGGGLYIGLTLGVGGGK